MPIRPSESEEQYFTRMELERRKAAEEERRAAKHAEEHSRRRELHHMKCPKCGGDLAEVEFHTVRIDRCPDCNGIWLDAGELEAITGRDRSVVRRLLALFSDEPAASRH
jgi:hypothetical protein